MLKSPSTEYFKQLATTENSIIDFASYPFRLGTINPAPKLSPPPTLSTICGTTSRKMVLRQEKGLIK